MGGSDDKLLVDDGSPTQAAETLRCARVEHHLVGKLALGVHLLSTNDTVRGRYWSTAAGVDRSVRNGRTLIDDVVHRDVRVVGEVALRGCQGSRDDQQENSSHPEDCGEGDQVPEFLYGQIQTQVFKRREDCGMIVSDHSMGSSLRGCLSTIGQVCYRCFIVFVNKANVRYSVCHHSMDFE